MVQKYPVYPPALAITSSLIALHPHGVVAGPSTGNDTLRLIGCLVLLSALALILLGQFLLLRGLRRQPGPMLLFAEILIWIIIVVVFSVFSAIAQNGMTEVFKGDFSGTLVGATAGGVIAACAGLVLGLIGRASSSHLAIIGAGCILAGFFIGLLQVSIFLVVQNWP